MPPFLVVILLETLTQARDLNSNGRVDLRIEAAVPAECLGSDGVLADRLGAVIPKIEEKRAQGRSTLKGTAGQHVGDKARERFRRFVFYEQSWCIPHRALII